MTFDEYWKGVQGPTTHDEYAAAEEAWNAARKDMQDKTQVLTCIFCGHEYPPGTPPSNHDSLVQHVKKCKKHPMNVVFTALRGLTDAVGNGEVDLENASIGLRDAYFDSRGILEGRS